MVMLADSVSILSLGRGNNARILNNPTRGQVSNFMEYRGYIDDMPLSKNELKKSDNVLTNIIKSHEILAEQAQISLQKIKVAIDKIQVAMVTENKEKNIIEELKKMSPNVSKMFAKVENAIKILH